MRTVGVIGGLGATTSAEFYLEVVFGCQRRGGKTRPGILLWSVPGGYEMERDSIERNVGTERYLPLIVDAARRLEAAGADFLVMPCNSLHVYISELRAAVRIPVLSIVEETARSLRVRDVSRVGVLATGITVGSGMYERALGENGIEVVVPSDVDQERLNHLVRNVVANEQTDDDRESLLDIVRSFADRGIGHVVLACTDLQLLEPTHEFIEFFDTMRILADATVERIVAN